LPLLPNARPPLTTIVAAVSSGRSSLAISALTKAELPLSATACVASIAALPPVAEAGRSRWCAR